MHVATSRRMPSLCDPRVSASLALLATACAQSAVAILPSPDAGHDLVVDAGSAEANDDASAPVNCLPLGTGALAIAGCPCGMPGALSCAGNTQPDVLVCSGGEWTAQGTCPGGQVCNSLPGPRQGTCATVVPQCISQPTGQVLCVDRWTVGVCSADMLLAAVEPCGGAPCVAGACGGAASSQ
jgi:hypothetical protein